MAAVDSCPLADVELVPLCVLCGRSLGQASQSSVSEQHPQAVLQLTGQFQLLPLSLVA